MKREDDRTDTQWGVVAKEKFMSGWTGMRQTPEPDPREAEGGRVLADVEAPYSLVPSQHATPMTGGKLDYGIGATVNGQRVVIGELFARAPMEGASEGVRLNTKQMGERIVTTLNGCASLNPVAYRRVIDTASRVLKKFGERDGTEWQELREALAQATA